LINLVETPRAGRCILFDWGDTLMRVLGYSGPMAGWPRVQVIPHAVEVLTGLRRHWLLALATNAADSDETDIRAALRRVGLDQLLDKVYGFRAIGHRKPSREFYTHIADDLKLDGSRLVMVGDDFEADVLGANQAGLYAIWFNGRSHEESAGRLHCTIHDFRELPAALVTLLADQV
jgi:putative hydrolase of the HAD superfamily